jgi:DNA-binding MarR family transcriptional regulator
VQASSTKTKRLSKPKAAPLSDREFGLRLGALMLNCLGSDSGGVIRVLDESGLSFVQMKALVMLAGEHDEPPTNTLLAEQLGISLASASRAVDGLVKRGLVVRAEDEHDRRIRRLSLTPEGQALAERMLTARLQGLERFAASLNSAERRKLGDALDLLLQRDEIAAVYRKYRKEAQR